MVATTVLFFYRMGGSGPTKHFLLLAMAYLLGFLMVSSIPFNSFKEFDGFQRMPFRTLFIIILLFSVIAVQPSIMLFTFALVYVSSGPIGYVFRLLRNRRESVTEESPKQEIHALKKRKQ
jgi:CDP-diacylglycerol--serine O-phosphatidyltransferase